MTSMHSRLALFDQVEHLHVLFERQGDVEVVDLARGRRSRRASASVPSSGSAAIAQMIAAGAVVDEADHDW